MEVVPSTEVWSSPTSGQNCTAQIVDTDILLNKMTKSKILIQSPDPDVTTITDICQEENMDNR